MHDCCRGRICQRRSRMRGARRAVRGDHGSRARLLERTGSLDSFARGTRELGDTEAGLSSMECLIPSLRQFGPKFRDDHV